MAPQAPVPSGGPRFGVQGLAALGPTHCVAQNQQEREVLDWGLRCLILEIVSLWKRVCVHQCYYIVRVGFPLLVFLQVFRT